MKSDGQKFEEAALPHLGAAYNLARWLTHNDTDAEDVVQEAYLRAFRHFDSFRGGDGRPWLLAIVRNTCYTWLQRNRTFDFQVSVDEETTENIETDSNPETLLLREANTLMVRQAVEKLPPEFREVIVLRELEELSYKQISEVVDVPIGTVMSRLARARKRLHRIITGEPLVLMS
jgi:RNA polymerase sigma-70 factor (ECF subfamily)